MGKKGKTTEKHEPSVDHLSDARSYTQARIRETHTNAHAHTFSLVQGSFVKMTAGLAQMEFAKQHPSLGWWEPAPPGKHSDTH